MREKICPIMAQGWVNAWLINSGPKYASITLQKVIEEMPKCLKEKCALWIPESFAGSLHGEEHCGLIRR